MEKAPAFSECLHLRGRCKPGSVPSKKAMAISLDKSLPTVSSNLPEFQLVRAAPGLLAQTEFCLVLHRMRFTVPPLSPGVR